MQDNAAMGVICVMTGVIGYMVFGWIGVAGGFLMAAFLAIARFLNHRAPFSPQAGRPPFSWEHWGKKRPASKHNAHLEALLAKAHLLADTFHDAYGARNCCLNIIRQTEKEDPLFIAAYDLFMRTVAPPVRSSALPEQDAASGSRVDLDPESREDADVIIFPTPVSRH